MGIEFLVAVLIIIVVCVLLVGLIMPGGDIW